MPKSVLVVDDAVLVRRMLRDVLDHAGYVVYEAVGGADAVEKYDQCRPDVVTLDLTMPDVGGLDVLRAIRALDPQARIVIVSALPGAHAAQDVLRAGAAAYVRKPFQPDTILEALRRVLGVSSECPC